MTAVKSAVRRAALFLLILPLLTFCAKGEEPEMSIVPVALQKSYKKAAENNPLYTQRFGADPGVMEYNGRLYVYMTDDLLEYDGKGNVKENSYQQIMTINCISSDDLVNWTDHGKIYVAGPRGAATWAAHSWAPCAAHKTIDGKEKFFDSSRIHGCSCKCWRFFSYYIFNKKIYLQTCVYRENYNKDS